MEDVVNRFARELADAIAAAVAGLAGPVVRWPTYPTVSCAVGEAMPCCTRSIRTVSSALT